MNRRAIGFIAAVVLAAFGTFVLLTYVRSAEDRALAGEQTVEVLVARAAIDKGAPAESLASLVERERVPAKVRAQGSVADLDDLEGKVAAVDVLPGEQIVNARFVTPEQLVAQSEVEVPDGFHEVTVSLEPQRVIAGQLLPGETVGVFMSFDGAGGGGSQAAEGGDDPAKSETNTTHLTLHKVLVTNVQTDTRSQVEEAPNDPANPRPKPVPGGNLFVTFALDAPSAERLIFAAEFGRIWLSAEPANAPEDGTTIQDRGTVYGQE